MRPRAPRAPAQKTKNESERFEPLAWLSVSQNLPFGQVGADRASCNSSNRRRQCRSDVRHDISHHTGERPSFSRVNRPTSIHATNGKRCPIGRRRTHASSRARRRHDEAIGASLPRADPSGSSGSDAGTTPGVALDDYPTRVRQHSHQQDAGGACDRYVDSVYASRLCSRWPRNDRGRLSDSDDR